VKTCKTKAYSINKIYRRKNKLRRSNKRKIKILAATTTLTINMMFIIPNRKITLFRRKLNYLQDLLDLQANKNSLKLVKASINRKRLLWNLTKKLYHANKLNLNKSSISKDWTMCHLQPLIQTTWFQQS